MKPLQQILIISLFTITAHQIDAYSWQDFRSDINSGWYRVNEWFATNITSPIRSWWYKTPGTEEAILIAAREALAKEQVAKRIALNKAIDEFYIKLTAFKISLEKSRLDNIQYIWIDDKDFFQELDSIRDVGMPKSIFDAAVAMNKPEVIESLRKAFEFLKPTITWDDLSDKNKNQLLTIQVPSETIQNLIIHLTKLTKPDRFITTYIKWLQVEGKATGKLIPSHVKPNDKILTLSYLPLLRSYKAAHVLEKLNNNLNSFSTKLDIIKKTQN